MSPDGREIPLRVVRLRPNASLPGYATEGSAGLDLAACLDEPVVLGPGRFARIPTGIALVLPAGHEGQVRPRSGLAAHHGITLLNSPGTLDEDYRGEVQVLLVNHGAEEFLVKHGERIAQLVVAPVTRVVVGEIDRDALDSTARGDGGFGSTGR